MRLLVPIAVVAACLPAPAGRAQMPDPPGQVAKGKAPRFEAYLFAHMTHADYGRLYYSVSLDGLHWKALNGGRRVLDDYRGHASIVKGHDGRYYLAGNRSDSASDINIWVSADLITWRKHADYTPDLRHVPDYPRALPRIGAPKLAYDSASGRYLLTWHTPHRMDRTDLPEPYWASQRTLFVTSSDLVQFSDPPRKLFAADLATIDTVVRREGDRYFAIFKDERYPTLDWPTGKTIRIATAPTLTGPFGAPGPPVSPGFREAPTLIPAPDGLVWYLYYEQYPGVAYGLSIASRLDGPWYQASGGTNYRDWDKFSLPPRVRHGSMIPISRRECEAIVKVFGDTKGH